MSTPVYQFWAASQVDTPDCVGHNRGVQRVRFTQSTRKHRIGRAHALHVMNNCTPTITAATSELPERRTWIGADDRGVELEIVAVVEPDYLLVIHVMPAHFRRSR